MNKNLTFVLLILCMIPLVNSQVEFYSGDIYVDSLHSVIDIQNKANISSDYVLKNKNNNEEKINLTFIGIAKNASIALDDFPFNNKEIIFGPNEIKKFHIEYLSEITDSNNIKILRFEPNILLNNAENPEKISSYCVKLILPNEIKSVVSFNKDYDFVNNEEKRTTYHWNKNNVYLTPLNVMWNNLKINLSVNQKPDSNSIIDFNQLINVTITIKNTGNKKIDNLVLSAYFIPALFEAVSPLNDFNQLSDYDMIIWNKNVDSLEKEEIKKFYYSIISKTNKTPIQLNPVSVRINGSLIAFSEEIEIDIVGQEEKCGNWKCEGKENYSSCPIDCISEKIFSNMPLFIGIILLICVLVVFIIVMKLKK